MKILIYGINYSPELTGIGKYTGEMAEWLVTQGHEVEVITALPYYPLWEVQKQYKGKLWFTETINGVKVHRCPLYVPTKVNAKRRMLHDYSFVLSILPFWFLSLFRKKADWVICVAPPFHLGLLPLIYSKLRGVKMLNHIQDLQVDAAHNLGMLKNKALVKLMFGLERFILKNSTRVSTLTLGMQNKVEAKNIPASKIILLQNWVDFNTVYPLSKEKSLRNEFGISQEDKVILYSGNLGEKQGLDILLDIAKDYTQQKDIHFLIVGAGAGKEKLQNLVSENDLKNVTFYPLQELKKLPALLATADVHLVLQKKSASDLLMPSKLTNILAAGACAIITAEPGTSLYEITSQHNFGILCEPESPEALKSSIEYALSTDLSEYKTNALAYAKDHLHKDKILNRFIEDLEKID
jgi:colanic acid biosynthesis glycosyl transferase WcaI